MKVEDKVSILGYPWESPPEHSMKSSMLAEHASVASFHKDYSYIIAVKRHMVIRRCTIFVQTN